MTRRRSAPYTRRVADLKPGRTTRKDAADVQHPSTSSTATTTRRSTPGARACARGPRPSTGPGGLESFDPATQEPEELAARLSTLSFAGGTRYLLADDAGGWKAAQLAPLESALAAMPPDTVLVLIVRGKPLKALLKAAEKAGAEVREYAAPKPWELPKWVVGRGRELGLEIDSESARELVDAVGTRQQQLARELEKLVMAIHPSAASPPSTWRNSGGGAGPQAYELADAVVAGDSATALALTEKLRRARSPRADLPDRQTAARRAPGAGAARRRARPSRSSAAIAAAALAGRAGGGRAQRRSRGARVGAHPLRGPGARPARRRGPPSRAPRSRSPWPGAAA